MTSQNKFGKILLVFAYVDDEETPVAEFWSDEFIGELCRMGEDWRLEIWPPRESTTHVVNVTDLLRAIEAAKPRLLELERPE